MDANKKLTEQESLQLITDMIQKARSSYHDRGTGAILWGTVVAIASFVTYLSLEYDFKLPFDIWLLVLAAIIPQVFISIKESRQSKVKKHDDAAVNAVWLVFGITIFGLIFYSNTVPSASVRLINAEGWSMLKHYTDGSKPDELMKPFIFSLYSLYLLIYALPTLVTGLAKKFRPMTIGAIITYGLFIASCFSAAKYDMLFGTVAAIVCWFIPGIILRKRYLASMKGNV